MTKEKSRAEKRIILKKLFFAVAMLIDADHLRRWEPLGWNNKHEAALIAFAASLAGIDFQETRAILSEAYTEARKMRK